MPRFQLYLLALLFFWSCKSGSHAEHMDDAIPSADSAARFYPFPQYLADQIQYVDSMPFAIMRIVKINGEPIDSGIVTKANFKQSVQPFTETDPNSSDLKTKYTEDSFQDLSLEAVTFSITAMDSELPLQQADILLRAETQKVKNVMLKRVLRNEDSTVVQQLLWIHNLRCQVSEIIDKKDGSSYTRSTTFIWDEPM